MKINTFIYKKLVVLAMSGTFFWGCSTIVYEPTRLDNRLSQKVMLPNNTPDKYALIIAASTEERHIPNLYLAHNILLENSFKTNNIYILTNHKEPSNIFYPLTADSSKKEIEKMLAFFTKVIDTNDFFFVYVTSHGRKITKKKWWGKVTNWAVLPLGNLLLPEIELFSNEEMSDYFKKIKPKTGVLVFDQCKSGGFAQKLGTNNYIAISASGVNGSTWGSFFPEHFFGSFKNKLADENKDGKLSVLEAFNYTKSKYNLGKLINYDGGPLLIYDKINPSDIILTTYNSPLKKKTNIFNELINKVKSWFE